MLGPQIRMDEGRQVARDEYMQGIGRMFRQFRTAPHASLKRRVASVAVTGNTGSVVVAQTLSFQDQAGDVQQLQGRLLQTWRKVGARWLLVQEREDR